MRKVYPNGPDAAKIKKAVNSGKEVDTAALAAQLNVDEKAVKKHVKSLTKTETKIAAKTGGDTK